VLPIYPVCTFRDAADMADFSDTLPHTKPAATVAMTPDM
jgi:hypothetical protein